MENVQRAARATGRDWEVIWCPSHLLDKNPPPVYANTKYEKAKLQPGWKDSYMRLNLEADTVATKALKEGSGLHGVIASQEIALAKAQAINAEIGIAVAKRLPITYKGRQ